ncbi:hypothetical protein B4U79_05687, partial [Dinothrombium tinctorium]
MSGLLPHPTSDHSSCKIFLPKELRSCSHVFIRDDKVKSPLQNAYLGPYKVESRTEKNFVLRINNRRSNISIDRLKPAFIENDIKSHEFTHYAQNTQSPNKENNKLPKTHYTIWAP